jgi:hypothetical protein
VRAATASRVGGGWPAIRKPCPIEAAITCRGLDAAQWPALSALPVAKAHVTSSMSIEMRSPVADIVPPTPGGTMTSLRQTGRGNTTKEPT